MTPTSLNCIKKPRCDEMAPSMTASQGTETPPQWRHLPHGARAGRGATGALAGLRGVRAGTAALEQHWASLGSSGA